MPRHPTYTITVPKADAQALVDRLNAPRSPESETTDPGLGPRTTPSDPTALTGLVSTGATVDTPTHRWLTLSVRPREEDRLETILEAVGADRATWHPEPDVDASYKRARALPEAQRLDPVADTDDTIDDTTDGGGVL